MVLKEMKRLPGFVLSGLSLVFLVIIGTGHADDERLLIYGSGQTTFFAEHEYALEWNEAEDTWPAMDDLVLSIIAANKILIQQHLPARFPAKFRLNCPELRPGVAMDATITISAYAHQQLQQNVYTQKVRFYAKEEPFLSQGIGPSEVGVIDKTSGKHLENMLKHFGIPFTPVNRLTDLPHKWIFCAGLNFNNTQLFDGLYALTGNGRSVLVLPPVKGKFFLPPFEKGSRFVLADHNIIKDMDKHLNLLTAGRASIQDESYQFKMIGGKPGMEIIASDTGFGWLTLRRNQGKMIFCGYNLFTVYEDNPSVGIWITNLLKNTTGN